jgi:hypothetical protein
MELPAPEGIPQMPDEPTSGGACQTPGSLTLETEAQQVLDELWVEKKIPIQLKVGKLTKGIGEYTIHFHDARIRTADIPLLEGHSFRDMVRAAVLARVAKLSGPLRPTKKD